MIKIRLALALVLLVALLSSCGIFRKEQERTNIQIIDPYGNSVFVSGKVNGMDIKIDDKGAYVPSKISGAPSVVLSSGELGNFIQDEILFDGSKVIIKLKKGAAERFAQFLRSSDGKLYFYAIGYGGYNYFQFILSDRLAATYRKRIDNNRDLLAGGYIIGLGKSLKDMPALNCNPNEIVVKLNIPADKTPRISSFEEVK